MGGDTIMRYFYLDKIYAVDEGQHTADEKQVVVDQAQETLNALEESSDEYSDAVSALDAANKIISSALSGAIDVTDCAEDIKSYSGTHTPSLVNSILTWTEIATELSTEEQIAEIDAQLTALNLAMVRPQNSIIAAQLQDLEIDPDDSTKLIELQEQATALRDERKILVGEL